MFLPLLVFALSQSVLPVLSLSFLHPRLDSIAPSHKIDGLLGIRQASCDLAYFACADSDKCCPTASRCCKTGGCCGLTEYCVDDETTGEKGCCPVGSVCIGDSGSTFATPSRTSTSAASAPTYAPYNVTLDLTNTTAVTLLGTWSTTTSSCDSSAKAQKASYNATADYIPYMTFNFYDISAGYMSFTSTPNTEFEIENGNDTQTFNGVASTSGCATTYSHTWTIVPSDLTLVSVFVHGPTLMSGKRQDTTDTDWWVQVNQVIVTMGQTDAPPSSLSPTTTTSSVPGSSGTGTGTTGSRGSSTTPGSTDPTAASDNGVGRIRIRATTGLWLSVFVFVMIL